MDFPGIGVGWTCEACGKEYEQRIDLTPAEINELNEKKRLTKKAPSRCPHCGHEMEPIFELGQIGQG